MSRTLEHLYAGRPGVTLAAIYTVPADTKVTIREVIMTRAGGTLPVVTLQLRFPSGNNRWYLISDVPENSPRNWSVRTVLNAGDAIWASQVSATNTADVIITGIIQTLV